MNRIRAARQALGWTQNDLASRAGVSARTIHAIEKGRPCRQATKRKILRTLKENSGDRARTADVLQVGYRTLLVRMKELGIEEK